MPLVSVSSINPVPVLMVCVPSTTQVAKCSWVKNFPLIFIAKIRQIFCLSPLLLMRMWCEYREYRLNTPSFLWDYSHLVPLNQFEVTSETWTSIIPFSGFSSWWCNIRPSLRCPCTVDWQFSRQARLLFPSGASQPIGNIRSHRMIVETWVETVFVGLPGKRSLSPRVSLSRAPVLSCAHYFQAPASRLSAHSQSLFLRHHLSGALISATLISIVLAPNLHTLSPSWHQERDII